MSAAQKEDRKLNYRESLRVIIKTVALAWQLDRFQVATFWVGAVLEIAGTIVATYAGAKLISLLFTAITNAAVVSSVWWWLAATIVSQLAINVGFWFMNYSQRVIYITASQWSSINFMRQLSTIDIGTFYETDMRNTINKLDNGHSWQVPATIQNSLNFVYGVVRALAIIVVIARLAWWLVPFLFIFLIPSLISQSQSAKASWFVWEEKGDERHIFWGIAYQVARARQQMEIHALQAKDKLLGIVDDMLAKFQTKQRKILKQANWSIGPSKIFEVIGIALVEVWLIYRLLYRHSLSISQYIFYSGIIARINAALNTVVSTYTQMQESVLYSYDYFAFLAIEPKIGLNENGLQLKSDFIPEITFKNVWFRYPGTDSWIFKNFDLTIKPGEHVAFVGENGAGKTTLVKLLLRFYDVDKGQILISGQDLRELSLPSWYDQLGTLFQQFNEYPLDVKHNVTIGKGGPIDEQRFASALRDSGVDQIVENLPFGVETVLDSSFKKGIEPSGGQWQRVALARAFYRNPNILILDEPTAAIDARAEYAIFNSIFENMADKTTLIISHRFSTVRRADRIIVLEHGKIVEAGSHEALIKKQSLYHDMFTKQAEGYK